MSTWQHQQRSVSLSGRWRVRSADAESRRTVADDDLDDSTWALTNVPGHWRDVEGLEHTDAVLYRHRFDTAPARGHRRWLSIDGLCYQGDVWLDGAYLGDTEGYFVQHVFDVTEQLQRRGEHLLAIEATCASPGDRLDKRNITGVLQHAEILDHDVDPGGLWRDVRIEETGDVRIDDLRLLVLEADSDRAILRLSAVLDSAATHTARVLTHVDPSSGDEGAGTAALHDQELVLARGRNEVEWHVAVETPALWWPRALGDQPLYDVRITVEVGGEVSHVRKRRTGIRSVELRNWIASVNGERLFLKGANLGPASIDLAGTTAADHRRDLAMAADAGLDLLRVHGHVASPALYREADRIGMLLWQDFPLQWGQARSVRAQATRQATLMVNQLGHHPSILLWSAHNEPGRVAHRPGERADVDPDRRFTRRGVWRAQLPSWNRTVLDRAVRRTLTAVDPTRPANPSSGTLPRLPRLDGTDSHLYFGWQHGEVADLRTLARRLPRLVRFVSEFGAQAIPHDETLAGAVEGARWPDVDTDTLRNRFGAQLELLERHSPAASESSFQEWATATQRRQAAVLRHTVEILRTLKYRPVGGYCQFLLNDSMPFVSPSVLDHLRRPKLGWQTMVAAGRPVLVVADLHRATMTAGTRRCPVHVVSDLRTEVRNATLEISWSAPGAEVRRWHFQGTFPADSVTRVARLRLPAPSPGIAELALELTAPGLRAANHYRVHVVDHSM